MLKRSLSFLLAFVMVFGMLQFPAKAEETETQETAAAESALETPQQQTETAVLESYEEEIVEGGEAVATDSALFPEAIKLTAGESKTYTFDVTANDGDMLLFSFAVRGETVCSEISVKLDFSGTDTTMKYYAPIQWSRIYMPATCSGQLVGATITVNTNAMLLGEATCENKGSATFEDLKLESGMWMLDDYEEVVLDADMGVKSTNEDIYTQLGVTSSNCIDLVISSCGNYIYSIGGGYLTVTDVSDPSNPKVRSIYKNDDYPTDYGDTRQICLIPGGGATGDAVIFTSRISGAFIVDVSDPDNPVETAHYDALEMATGLAVYEDYAFVCNRQYGVEVVDISDIYNPVHLGTVARGGEIQSCKVVDGILYAGAYNYNRVEMYDIRDPFAPVLLSYAKMNGRGDAMTVATVGGKTYLYAGTGHHAATDLTNGTLDNLNYGQGNGLEIFDVTDPTNPVLLSVSKTDGRFCHSKCDYWGAEVSIHNGKVYVYLLSTYNGVYVFDATDPAAPVRLAHVTARVDKDSPYYNTSNFSHTSSVYPVIFQYDPQEYKQAPIGSVTVHEGALYMAGVYTDLHICQADWAYSITEDPDPVQIAPTTAYYDYALVTTRPGGQAVAVANHGNYLYVAAGNQGILIYSKDLKTLHKTIPVEDVCYDLYIQDGKLYAAEGRNGAAVYTISADGMTLTETKRYVSSVDLVTTIRPSATGKFIALHVGSTRGEMVDISGTPNLVASCSTSTQAYHHNVEISENGRYVVFWGLYGNEQWYDFGANDGNSVPKRLSVSPFRSMAAMAGGYTAYKGNTVIMTRSNGYVYYDPTALTAAQILDLANNHLIKAVTGYGSTTKTSIYGRGFVYENLLITCDRIYGRMYITDISDIDNPVLLKSWTGIKGNPDIANVVDKTLYVPMGYEGIMMVDLEDYLAPHVHCVCGGQGKVGTHTACTEGQWTPISEALENVGLTTQTADFGKLPSGNYYLDSDIVVTGLTSIGTKTTGSLSTTASATKDLNICLNGHTVTTTKGRVFGNVKAGSSLTITDCVSTGTIYGGTEAYGQILYTHAKSTLNIYGGNFTSQNTGTGGGLFVIACDQCGDVDGDGDMDDTDKKNSASKAVFNLYGGKLYGGKAANGGNITLYHSADMNMYGGTIKDGTATTGAGGNIMNYSNSTIRIEGGTISGGTAKTYGGNISNSSGTLRIYGGEVLGGTCGTYGGSIYNAKTFYMYGGTVSGGTSGNNAGGNVIIGSSATFNMYGGTIKDGTAPTNYGGNIQVLGKAYLCGGTIKDGTAKYGGNIAVYNKGIVYNLTSTATREDLYVLGGTATSGQGSSIYIGYTSATPPTASFKWGTFTGGEIFVGPNAKVSIDGNPVIDFLRVDSGRSVTFGTFTEGASVKVKMTDYTGVFGTGTAATLPYLTADYEMKHENGSLSLVAPDSISLRYDDRKPLSALIGTVATDVTITQQTVTSKKVGTETLDTAVIAYDAATDTLYAVGTGTATLTANGKSYPVTVEAAPISLFMITGHSIGEGYLADGKLSVVSEAGQVYGSFGRESLTSNAGGLGYGADSRVSDSLDIYTPGKGGTASAASALGYQWNQTTGEKVWVLNAAIAGSCINEWLPGAANHSSRYDDYYNTAITMFQNAQTVVANEVAAGHYTYSHMAMFYFGGANFKWYVGWTQEKLQQDYATFWGGMKQDLSMDIDGDGKTETVETLGLVPAWSPSLDDYAYDKAASFYMAASSEYPDIYMALDYRNWVTDLSSFPVYDYETQSGEYWQPESIQHTNKGGTSDKSIFCSNDTTHHSQIGYNAIGMYIADSLIARLSGQQTTTGVLQTMNAKDAPETIVVDLGESVSLVPLVSGTDVTVTVSGQLTKRYPLTLTAAGYEGGIVTISKDGTVLDTVTVEVRPEHKHCLCGGVGKLGDHTTCADVVWTPISTALENVGLTTETADFGKLPSGYYYLDTDVTVTGISNIGAASGMTPTTVKELYICLNGYEITTTQTRVFGNIRAGSSLNIADCTGDGTVYGGTAAHGQILYTYAGATLNIFGGNFTSNNTATTAGLFAIASDACGDLDGDGDDDGTDKNKPAAKSVMNLYGGKLYGGKAGAGGNVVVYHCCDMNMYGGEITGGTATSTMGGNILSYSVGTISLLGGQVSNGYSTTYGGNIVMSTADGTLIINGGKVIDGTSKTYGGNISNAATFNLYSGTVTGGTAGSFSGNIHNSKNFYMYGGTVTGGTAKSGAGGNMVVGTGSKFCIYGGTVENGSATAQGGNIHILGNAYLCGGTIQNGVAKEGTNIAVYNKGYAKAMISTSTREALVVDELYVGYTGGTTPTIELENGTFTKVYVGNDAKATVSKATVVTQLVVSQGQTCSFTGLTEGASIGITMEVVTDPIGAGAADQIKYLTSLDEAYVVTCKEGTLYLAAPVAEADGKAYGSVNDALVNTTSYVKLTTDVTEDVEITGDAYLDLAGHTLTGNVTGAGTLYGMDSTTDAYTTDNMGRITGSVSCKVATTFKTNVTGAVRRYMAIADEEGCTFHRFYLGITYMNLKPGVTGVGYKAYFYGDEQVREQVTGYGYTLWVGDGEKLSAGKEGPFASGKALTLRLQNFDVAAYGETPVYGQVYLILADGSTVTSSDYSYTLRSLVETVAANVSNYSETQLSALRTMLEANSDATADWNIDSLRS